MEKHLVRTKVNTDPIDILQVERRSVEGITKPFLCLADDGKRYWVKGKNCGVQGLCREWVAGRLAMELGLNIAPFRQALVPEDLLRKSMMPDIAELGAGIVFASEKIEGVEDFKMIHIDKVDIGTRRTLIAFDFWIQNEDRSLGPLGGNVNLLWQTSTEKMVVIDHNNAFDPQFSMEKLKMNHVFGADVGAWERPFVNRLQKRMQEISGSLQHLLDELPEQWAEPARLNLAAGYDIMESAMRQSLVEGGLVAAQTR